jgi:hypothetical protein
MQSFCFSRYRKAAKKDSPPARHSRKGGGKFIKLYRAFVRSEKSAPGRGARDYRFYRLSEIDPSASRGVRLPEALMNYEDHQVSVIAIAKDLRDDNAAQARAGRSRLSRRAWQERTHQAIGET